MLGDYYTKGYDNYIRNITDTLKDDLQGGLPPSQRPRIQKLKPYVS